MVTLSERLNSGEVLIGSFVSIAHPVVVEIAGCSGLDFVIVDMEHTYWHRDRGEHGERLRGRHRSGEIPRIDEALIGSF